MGCPGNADVPVGSLLPPEAALAEGSAVAVGAVARVECGGLTPLC